MELYKKLGFKNIFRIIMIAFSIYILFIATGICLNSAVNLKYETASIEDIAYVYLYSKVLIIYIILVLVMLVFLLRK